MNIWILENKITTIACDTKILAETLTGWVSCETEPGHLFYSKHVRKFRMVYGICLVQDMFFISVP